MEAARQPMLDAVRGVAILLVLGFHFRAPLGVAPFDAILQPVFAIGWAGVDLFFVLSGFLVGRHLLEEIARTGRLDVPAFALRRAVRLWPVLWLYLATLVALGGTDILPRVWPVLLHVQNYVPGAPSHLWSLAVEEHFYLLAALALPPLWRRGGARAVAGAIVFLLFMCLALRLTGIAYGVPFVNVQWQTPYRLDAPAFGILLALATLVRPACLSAAARARLPLLLGAMIGITMVGYMGDAARYGGGLVLTYLSAGAVVIAAAGTRSGGRGTAAMRTLAWLGRISYPLYLWHASIGVAVRSAVPSAPNALVVSVALSVIVAAALNRWIEIPLQRWFRIQHEAAHLARSCPSIATASGLH